MKTKIENFTIQFSNIQPESCELQLMWEKTLVTIPVSSNIKERLRLQIESALRSDSKPYWQAAQFYNEYEKNYTRAIEYCNKAIEESPKAYWIYLYKAKIQLETGDLAGAKTSSNRSLALAREDMNDDYVKMNEELLRKIK
jgi:tetratricopeptide (TPR) repeat protein